MDLGCDSPWLSFYFIIIIIVGKIQSVWLGREIRSPACRLLVLRFPRLSLPLSAAPKIPLTSPCSSFNPLASLRCQNSMTAFEGRNPCVCLGLFVCLFVCIFLLCLFPLHSLKEGAKKVTGRRLPERNCICRTPNLLPFSPLFIYLPINIARYFTPSQYEVISVLLNPKALNWSQWYKKTKYVSCDTKNEFLIWQHMHYMYRNARDWIMWRDFKRSVIEINKEIDNILFATAPIAAKAEATLAHVNLGGAPQDLDATRVQRRASHRSKDNTPRLPSYKWSSACLRPRPEPCMWCIMARYCTLPHESLSQHARMELIYSQSAWLLHMIGEKKKHARHARCKWAGDEVAVRTLV